MTWKRFYVKKNWNFWNFHKCWQISLGPEKKCLLKMTWKGFCVKKNFKFFELKQRWHQKSKCHPGPLPGIQTQHAQWIWIQGPMDNLNLSELLLISTKVQTLNHLRGGGSPKAHMSGFSPHTLGGNWFFLKRMDIYCSKAFCIYKMIIWTWLSTHIIFQSTNPSVDIWVPKMRFTKNVHLWDPNWIDGAWYGIFLIFKNL